MVQPEPMPDFMRRCHALVEPRQASTGKSTRIDFTSICDQDRIIIIVCAQGFGEVAEAEQTVVGFEHVGQVEDVEIGVCAPASGGLHFQNGISGRPVVVVVVEGVDEFEGDPQRAEIRIEDVKLNDDDEWGQQCVPKASMWMLRHYMLDAQKVFKRRTDLIREHLLGHSPFFARGEYYVEIEIDFDICVNHGRCCI